MSIEPVSHFYTCQRLRLHYLDWGNEAAPPLILLHGGRDHARSWDWVARDLRDQFHVIVPDLRGHGDSAWSPDGDYTMLSHTFDLIELVHQLGLAPVAIVGHSLGGAIALRQTGLYPQSVAKLVAIEGLGLPPELQAKAAATSFDARIRKWVDFQRLLAARVPRRYPTIEAALERMMDGNRRLTSEQAHHLTVHGVRRNDDGSYSWKFDNFVRSISPVDLPRDQLHELWGRIACPTLLVYGRESWASNPLEDGRAQHFANARVTLFENAGHWVHHDQLDDFLREVRAFLTE